ncbi:hypothetical protein [Dactylosporangium sp. NPDC000521]|uniref:hypothetical protein n=1 Tax=Dactylosporangium sp. NPDC000521 TaxID=3363975 RepID=UPI0036A114F6
MTGGLTVGTVLHRTDKSLVTAGTFNGVPVVVKTITTDDAYWMERRRELAAYRWFGEPEVLWAAT